MDLDKIELIAHLIGWKVDKIKSNENFAYIFNDEKFRISIHLNKGQYRFNAVPPRGLDSSVSTWGYYGISAIESRVARVGMDKQRDAFAIAEDLKRRMIQHLPQLYKQANEQIESSKDAQNKLELIRQAMARLLPGTEKNNYQNGEYFFHGGRFNIYRFSRGDSNSIKFENLSDDELVTLAAAYKNIKAKNGK